MICPGQGTFKSALNKVYLVLQPASFFGIGRRQLSILHTRLRLKHNQLNHHLYRLGIEDSPACFCGYPVESEVHYFLSCPNYTNQRNSLFYKIKHVFPPDMDTYYMCAHRPNKLLNVLLYGSQEFTVQTNTFMFNEVQTYIETTERFRQY